MKALQPGRKDYWHHEANMTSQINPTVSGAVHARLKLHVQQRADGGRAPCSKMKMNHKIINSYLK